MAERTLSIDNEDVTIRSLPKTVAKLRTAFRAQLGDKAIWFTDPDTDELAELRDADLSRLTDYFRVYTAGRKTAKVRAGDPASLFVAFEAGTRLQTARGPARALPPMITPFSHTKQRVVVCDPYLVSGARPLDRFLPKAPFELRVASARFQARDIGVRNTCAALIQWARRGEIVDWIAAAPEGERPGWRYSVDYGVGCFMSEKLAAGLAPGGPRYDKLTSWLDNRGGRVSEVPFGSSRVYAFATGLGDGSYLSFWGLDAAGEVLALVTDFALLAA
jgi:hypothetical protein